MRIKCAVIILSVVTLVSFTGAAEEQDERLQMERTLLGKFIELKSGALKATVWLRLFLPEGYNDSTLHYPVLLTFRSYQTASGILNMMYPDMILVDVSNFNYAWFSLYEQENKKSPGGANDVIAFLKKELIPFIDSNFRTTKTWLLMGSSSGGLFAINTILKEPGLFDAAFAAGPMFAEFDERILFPLLNESMKNRKEHPSYLFYTCGDQPELLPYLDTFHRMLQKLRPRGLIWKFDPARGEDHRSLVIRTLHSGLKWYLSFSFILSEKTLSGGKEAFDTHLKKTQGKFGPQERLPFMLLSTTTSHYRMDKNYDSAIETASLLTEIQPDNPFSHFTLAETFADAGLKEQARSSYRKALEKAREKMPGFVDFITGRLHRLEKK